MAVCGRLRIVYVRLLVFFVSFSVVCGGLWSFTRSLWSSPDGLWSFAGGLSSFVLVFGGLWSLAVLVTTINELGLNVLVFCA